MYFHVAGIPEQSSRSCTITGNKQKGFIYHCDSRRLSSIPTHFDSDTIGIYLKSNRIKIIKDGAFSNLTRLREINLYNNVISQIQPLAFKNCTSLMALSLEGNSLDFTSKSVPLKVFETLDGLLHFETSGNKKTGRFPIEICQYMKKLEYLDISIFRGFQFPDACKNMTRLQTIVLHPTDPLQLKNDTLKGLRALPIRLVSIVGYSKILSPIEADFLEPVQNIKVLHMSYKYRKASIKESLSALLYPLRSKTMDAIYLDYIRSSACEELQKGDFNIIKTICVKTLSLQSDRIAQTNLNSMIGSRLWQCLENFDISGNMDTGFDNSYMFLASLPRIRRLNVCCQRITRDDLLARNTITGNRETNVNTFIEWSRLVSIEINVSDSLEWYSMADIDYQRNHFINIDLKMNAKRLRYLDASGLLIDGCYGRFRGLTGLKTLRIQRWNCSLVHPEFITHLTSVEDLTFSSLNLGQNFMKFSLLQNLSRIHTLNISDNKITYLKDDIFRSQESSLNVLDMSYNNLHFLPTSLMTLKRLRHLDLRHNQISSFSDHDILFINKHDSLSIKLEGNILECACGSMTFLRWINSNQKKISDLNIVKCIDDNGSLRTIVDILIDLQHKKLACNSKFWLSFSVSGLIILLLLISMSTILYKFSADVRYVYARIRRYIWRTQSCVSFLDKYHAFVSYGDSSYEWAVHILMKTLEGKGFRLCVPDRDFTPGRDQVDNIIDSIDNSKRVIFVLTRDFLENNWCEWQIQMARIHAFKNDNENFLIVIIKDNIKIHEIPSSLQKIWIE